MPSRMLFTLEQYERMWHAGILGEDDRIELIEGEIVEMSPVGDPHIACVNRLNRLLVLGMGERSIVSVQNTFKLPPRSAPEPDLVVFAARDDFYESQHPTTADALLVIEVCDTSLLYDRSRKAPMYARSGVRHLWLVDLNAPAVEVYQEPTADGYLSREVIDADGSLSVEGFPDLVIRASDLFGRA